MCNAKQSTSNRRPKRNAVDSLSLMTESHATALLSPHVKGVPRLQWTLALYAAIMALGDSTAWAAEGWTFRFHSPETFLGVSEVVGPAPISHPHELFLFSKLFGRPSSPHLQTCLVRGICYAMLGPTLLGAWD